MRKSIGLVAALLLCAHGAVRAEPLEFFLPHGEEGYLEGVRAPHAFFGFEPGQQHAAPELLAAYFTAIAAASDRVAIAEIGRSHEHRPLLQVYISSPENIANLDTLRERHLRATSAQEDSVLFVNLSYSIHGNEPSGANAAPLIAYYLAATQDAWVDALLRRTVVIIEPMQNPDGLARFSQWANGHQGLTPNYDSQNRDRNSSWPSGRSNHYWFDLNRDWIFQVHPESRARVAAFRRWRPHVLGDYHEMGSDAPSYFFQPGHPRRVNPLTLPENQRITTALARFHAAALDDVGQAYFTQERFDDFYYGKGSAYPDAIGGVGLLFEQTAVSGHHRDFDGIRLTFAQAIANQVTTSISLLRGADALRGDLIAYRFQFDAAQAHQARARPRASGYVFGDGGDPARAAAFMDVLRANGIEVRALDRVLRIGGEAFEPGHAWVALASGREGRLTHALFDTTTTFDDNIFYDVSTWNLAMAFDLPFAAYAGATAGLGEVELDRRGVSSPAPEDAAAYAFSWNQQEAPRLLEALLEEGLLPRVSLLPFRGATAVGVHSFSAGAVTFMPRNPEQRRRFLRTLERVPGVAVVGLSSGLTPDGPDLGSREMKVVRPVHVALLVGGGVDSSEAGEIWHMLDQRVGMPVTQIDLENVGRMDLSRYTHILMPGGAFRSLRAHRELRAWLQQGGVLVAQKEAAHWAFENIVKAEEENADDSGDDEGAEYGGDGLRPRFRAYQDYDHDRAEGLIPGAVYRMELDLTHPLAFGYERPYLDVMRTSEEVLEPAQGRYDTPARYAREPLQAGYSSASMVRRVAGEPAVTAHRVGEGLVIAFADNLNFRGIWRGGSRMYFNAIFFAQAIEQRDED